MKCQNSVTFKSVEERDGGSFTNANGQLINYDKSYLVRFDEDNDGVIAERKVKFKGTNVALYTKFKTLKVYDKINLIFDVSIQNQGCKIEITDFTK